MTDVQAKSNPPLARTVRVLRFVVLLALGVAGTALWGDPPERGVWNDPPQPWDSRRLGPRTEPVELGTYQRVLYVSVAKGSDTAGKGTSECPWKSLTRALQEAKRERPEGTAGRLAILVGRGAYTESPIRMIEDVDLFGGFDERTWTRDIVNCPTLLDGARRTRVVVAADRSRLDGFVLAHGRVRGSGAALLCLRTAPVISNNLFIDNLTLEPEGFVHDPNRRRHVGHGGGAIACVDGAHPVIRNNLIVENRTEVGNGGGIECRDDSCPRITGNVIWGNRTGLTDLAPTRSSNGGGIACFAGCDALIDNNLVANNESGGRSDGGGIYLEYHSSPRIAYNRILGNHSGDDGGGLEIMKGSFPNVDSNILAGNTTSQGGGGGIRISDRGLGNIVNNLIVSNSNTGVTCSNGWMFFANNLVTRNWATKTGALFLENEHWIHLMPPILVNNIVYRNETHGPVAIGDRPRPDHPEPVFSHNFLDREPRLEDDWVHLEIDSATFDSSRFRTRLILGGGNEPKSEWEGRVIQVGEVWSVVCHVDESSLVVWGRETGLQGCRLLPTYRPLPDSPCIDAGQPTERSVHDFSGNRRKGRTDIGPYDR